MLSDIWHVATIILCKYCGKRSHRNKLFMHIYAHLISPDDLFDAYLRAIDSPDIFRAYYRVFEVSYQPVPTYYRALEIINSCILSCIRNVKSTISCTADHYGQLMRWVTCCRFSSQVPPPAWHQKPSKYEEKLMARYRAVIHNSCIFRIFARAGVVLMQI